MTISGSLSNALSGLRAAAHGAEVVAANVANALTDGYGQRELNLSAVSLGGNGVGVAVIGIHRSVDQQTISERRLVGASLGHETVVTGFFEDLKNTIGTPDSAGSLTSRLAALEATLIEAASRPDSETRLTAVVNASNSLINHLNSVSEKIQSLRMQADQEIVFQTTSLNEGLAKISDLNSNIRRQIGLGHDATALMDLRQQIVDKISSIVPLKEVPRSNGQIALYTAGGAVLLDGKAAVISFSSVGIIVPEMTIGSGALSGLSINGQPISSPTSGPLSGGSLAGLFAIRDEHATKAQTQLDAVARDLIEKFADPAIDPSLSSTSAGLFTDTGAAFSASDEIGLSERISLSLVVDPNFGGSLWKIRNGLAATNQGNVGDASILNALAGALTEGRISVSGGFIGAARTSVGLAGDFLSLINTELNSAEANQSFEAAKYFSLKNTELQRGVDTDAEMQKLLLIEQAFSANARVITTIDQMVQTLLRLQMTFLSIGDLAASHQCRRQNYELKTTLQQLSQELASGKKSDISTATTGDFGPIAALERSLLTATSYKTVTTEATLLTSSMQIALEQIQNNSAELATSLLVAGTSSDPLMMETTATDAMSKFGAALAALNVRVADRYAFSGNSTDTQALADEGTILSAIELAISAETTAQGVESVLNTWFDDPGGGFDSIAYTGSNVGLGTFRLSDKESIDLKTTAAIGALREVLKGLVMATLVNEGTFNGTPEERANLARTAGENLHSSQFGLTALRANLGSTEARIDNVAAQNAAQTASLEIARAELISVDPFQVATQLEGV